MEGMSRPQISHILGTVFATAFVVALSFLVARGPNVSAGHKAEGSNPGLLALRDIKPVGGPKSYSGEIIASVRIDLGHEESQMVNVAACVLRMDGKVIQPGEVFSFNEVVGERTEERGFVAGPMYSGGAVVSGIGGGICVAAIAVYHAGLLADMEIIERHRHSGPVSFADPGLDAAVVFGQKDMRWRNKSNGPVTVAARIDGRYLVVALYGKHVPGREVRLVSEDYREIPPVYVPEGQELRSGYEVTIYREVRINGKIVRREEVNHDVMPAQRPGTVEPAEPIQEGEELFGPPAPSSTPIPALEDAEGSPEPSPVEKVPAPGSATTEASHVDKPETPPEKPLPDKVTP